MLNEIGFIEACIRGIQDQTCPSSWIREILVVDGGSTDGSRELVLDLAAKDPRVRLIDNPRVVAAAAANIGIENATTDMLCFLSAHGVPDLDYVEKSVLALVETGAVGVGGSYRHEGLGERSMAIGLAMASPFGMASPHRIATTRQEVDTISHPVFLRQAMLEAGGYNEDLHRNEDYEMNYRLRKNGGVLVFTPEISTVYRPRPGLSDLAKQFFAYGEGKTAFLYLHPEAIKIRHLIPPLVIALGASLGLASIFSPLARRLLAAGGVAYSAGVTAATIAARPSANGASSSTFVAALPTIHVSWGSGVLVEAARRGFRKPGNG